MKDLLEKAINYSTQIGAHFVEIRYDNMSSCVIQRINEDWRPLNGRNREGIGVTCYFNGSAGYSFTASQELSEINMAVERAFKIAKASAPAVKLKLDFTAMTAVKSDKTETLAYSKHPKTQSIDFKRELILRTMKTAQAEARNANIDVVSLIGLYGENYGQKLFMNSEGSQIDWNFNVVDLGCMVTSKTADAQTSIFDHYGGSYGLELYDQPDKTPEKLANSTISMAKDQKVAKNCPAGTFRALIGNRLAGVLAHESFGHLSEGDFVVTGNSPLYGKVGQKLGSECVTIVDTGRPEITKYGGIWLPYDDQGIKTQKTVIMENGVLKHYLHNRGTAKFFNQSPTGNCRAVHFGFIPIPRMTNTYFQAGDLSLEEALQELGTGIYSMQTSGGEVELDGNFLFISELSYWVDKGEIQYPLKTVSLAGNIVELLGKVKGITKDFQIYGGYFGGCGKSGQNGLPVGLGGCKLVIDGVRFGGK